MVTIASLQLNQKHYMPERLPDRCGLDTLAYWAYGEPENLLVFVHGFWGNPTTTWHDFPAFLAREPVLGTTDVVFFGYDGKTNAANPSALAFLEFLEELIPNPKALVEETVGPTDRPAGHRHRRIVIAGHSLGAVVTRRALLWAARKNHAWLDRVKMVLFAPAHHGAYAAVLASSFLTGNSEWWLGKVLSSVALYQTPLIQDLMPESVVLKSLLADSQAALAAAGAGPAPGHLAAAAVVWAQDERVVINNDFGRDPVPSLYKGRHHMNVCKPASGFRDPVDAVVAALNSFP